MNLPPTPALSDELLARAAALRFKPTIGATPKSPELGVFVDEDGREVDLILCRLPSFSYGCGWSLAARVTSEAPSACIPFVFERRTFHVLHEGELRLIHSTILDGRDGVAPEIHFNRVTWEGRQYTIRPAWDGLRCVAIADPVEQLVVNDGTRGGR